jgi:hypothetical protein
MNARVSAPHEVIMKCEEVRLRLAAYRRSEWSAAEQQGINEHLGGCSACRQWEAAARGVGDHLRDLPTIVPPPSLRANVFAAIRQEQLAAATRVAETARPAVPVERALPPPPAPIILPRPIGAARPVRPAVVAPLGRIGEVMPAARRLPRIVLGPRTAIATIAALFLIMFTVHALPFNTLGSIAQNGVGGGVLDVGQPQIPLPTLQADAQYPMATSAIANQNEIFYVGKNAAGQDMLIGYNRSSRQSQYLFAQPTTQTVTLLALSNTMLVWLAADGAGWAVHAAPLAEDGTLAPMTLAPITFASQGQSFGNSILARFMGLWADGTSIAFTAIDSHGAMLLERADYAGATKTLTYSFITEALPNHSLAQPYVDGTTVYWVDKSIATDGTMLGVLWQQAGDAAAVPLNLSGSAFSPVAAGGHLAWFQLNAPQTADDAIVTPLAGTVALRPSAAAAPQTVVNATIDAANVWRGPGYLMWRDASHVHIFLVGSIDRERSYVQLPDTYTALGLSATAVTWVTPAQNGQTSTITVQGI